jgi:hypothetical protein
LISSGIVAFINVALQMIPICLFLAHIQYYTLFIAQMRSIVLAGFQELARQVLLLKASAPAHYIVSGLSHVLLCFM